MKRTSRGENSAKSAKLIRAIYCLAGLAELTWAAHASAVTVTTWTGSAGDNNFNNGANWSAGLPAAPPPYFDGDFNLAPANYPGGGAPALSGAITMNGLIFDASGWTIGGSGTLTLNANGDGVVDDATDSGNVTISVPVSLGGGTSNSTAFNISAGDTLALTGIVSGSNVKLSSTGPGTLTLNGSVSNTFGDLTVSAGTVALDMGSSALATSTGNLDLSGNSVAIYQASSQLAAGKSFRIEDSSIVNLNGFNQTLQTLTFRATSANGVGTGAGSINLNGGVLTLSGSGSINITTQNNGNTTTAVISGNGNATSGLALAGTGTTTITTNDTAAAVDLSISANISGLSTNTLTKTGLGVAAFSGTDTYAGTTIVSQGTLILDFTAPSAPASNIINNSSNSSALTLNGGTLQILGSSTGANTQQFNGLTVSGGIGSSIQLVTNATPQNLLLSLGTITRSANNGSTVDFELPAGTQGSSNGITTNTVNTNGILGAYATVGYDDWATNSTNAVGGNVVAYSSYNATFPGTGGSSTTNYWLTGIGSLTASEALNTLKISNANASDTLGLGSNSLTTAGVLYVGGQDNNYFITGTGKLSDGVTSELILNAAVGNLTVSCPVVSSSGTNAGVLTKAGAGTVTLTGASVYTGKTFINGGVLALNNSVNNTPLGNTQLEVNAGATLAAEPANGTTLNVGTTSTSAAGALLYLNPGSTFTMNDSAIGTFTVVQNSSDTATPLLINNTTLDFSLSSAGADELIISGNSTKGATLSGTNLISVTGLGSASLGTGPYTLISIGAGGFVAASGGTLGSFALATPTIVVGGQTYDLSLTQNASSETLTVTAAPEPAAGPVLLALAMGAALARRRRPSNSAPV